MFPFWDSTIQPVLEAIGARRVVEIGALRGENTQKMIDALGPGTEVHVIDPLPQFDPDEHRARFGENYHFHRDLSLNVLDKLPAMDAALIDGDHNWYTVHGEMTALAATADRAGRPLPVCILHDVGWPYGRRDLYYDPTNIPADQRQPFERKGMRKHRSDLVDGGGFNRTLANARHEGGPRNGVLTGMEDFIAEYPHDIRVFRTPVYHGLAIVADMRTLEARPALAGLLDSFEGPAGQRGLLELAEDIRLEAARWEQLVFAHHERLIDRSARRYLDLLARGLVDDLGFEQQLRIDHLLDHARKGLPPMVERVMNPAITMQIPTRRLEAARATGRTDDGDPPTYFSPTEMGRHRLEVLRSKLDEIRTGDIAGALVECGTGRGGGAVFMRGYLDAHEIEDRDVVVIDEFRAPAASLPTPGRGFDLTATLDDVRGLFERFGLLDEQCRFVQGKPAKAAAIAPVDHVALLRLGPTLPIEDSSAVLSALAPRLTPGATVIVDGGPAMTAALAPGLDSLGGAERIDDHAVAWTITVSTAPKPAVTGTPAGAPHPASAAPTISLSMVVVFYDMQREARRTLHSLSRAYQRDVEHLDYEVLVIDNGSPDGTALSRTEVEAFGPEFRYLDLGDGATASPTTALNRGMQEARGAVVGFMIDGAHVLSPGVLHFADVARRAHGPAVVATQQWYVGPGQQPDTMAAGYDESAEDDLFAIIAWPSDGYRLFEISHFIGDRDWFDGIWESNCLFVPREVLDAVGGYDDSFDEPGGEYSNLEFFERTVAHPGVNVVTIVGEGSFHQLHDGTTTNVATPDERNAKIRRYAERYAELRGRGFRSPQKQTHLVGAPMQIALRTKPRRRTSPVFFTARTIDGEDGRPSKPHPIPEEIATHYLEAFWASPAGRESSWLGLETTTPVMDLFAYQQLITETTPDCIVVTGSDKGGRARFLATVCDARGAGRVIAVTPNNAHAAALEHPRITTIVGRVANDDAVGRAVVDDVRDESAMVILAGHLGMRPTLVEFQALESLVPTGGYVVVEQTIVDGRPVWPGFGPGPGAAVDQIVNQRGEWVADPAAERHNLTFNRGGFLKRLT